MTDTSAAPAAARERARFAGPNTASVLAVGSLFLYAAVLAIILFQPIPESNKDIVAGAVGLIGGTLVGGAFGYYFGSSKSSQTKDDAIAAMAQGGGQ